MGNGREPQTQLPFVSLYSKGGLKIKISAAHQYALSLVNGQSAFDFRFRPWKGIINY